MPGGGYSGLKDVRRAELPHSSTWSNWNNRMESFLVSETFKYLFLMFSEDDVLPLDEFVFNTEAHAFPVQRAAAVVDKQRDK